VARMRYARFLMFSLVGGIFWIAFMTTLGYQLGRIPMVQRNFEKVVVGVVLLSLVPIALEARKKRTKAVAVGG
jgi:membrane-associated protein